MGILDRLREKPEPQRRRLFRITLAVVSVLLVGLWLLSFRVTLQSLSLKTLKDTLPETQERSTLDAVIGERFQIIKKLFPFFKRTLPGREEIIK